MTAVPDRPITRLILVAHAPLASAFRALAMHTFPECSAEVEAIDIPADAGREQAAAMLRSALSSQPDRPTLLLADVAGATPANALADVLPEYLLARALVGLNLPMLWRTLCYRTESPAELVELALAGAQRGITPL